MARSTPLRIVIAYDNLSDGVRAWELSERLASRFREDLQLDCDLWKFDSLRDAGSRLRQASLEAVMEADVVMIAAGGLEDLPADVCEWIDSWPPRLDDDWAALVASVGPQAQSSAHRSPVYAYLQQRAEAAGMDFFCNEEYQPASSEPILPHQQLELEQCEAASM